MHLKPVLSAHPSTKQKLMDMCEFMCCKDRRTCSRISSYSSPGGILAAANASADVMVGGSPPCIGGGGLFCIVGYCSFEIYEIEDVPLLFLLKEKV